VLAGTMAPVQHDVRAGIRLVPLPTRTERPFRGPDEPAGMGPAVRTKHLVLAAVIERLGDDRKWSSRHVEDWLADGANGPAS
jgi:hypothetical protein